MARKVSTSTWVIVIVALVASICLSVAVVQCHTNQVVSDAIRAESAANAAKEEASDAIQTTPSADLVTGSPRADELERTREGFVDEFTRRSADRIRDILLGRDSQGAP